MTVVQLVGGDSVNGVKYVSCDMYSLHCVGTSDPQRATKFIINRDAADIADQLMAIENPQLCLNVWEGHGQVNVYVFLCPKFIIVIYTALNGRSSCARSEAYMLYVHI